MGKQNTIMTKKNFNRKNKMGVENFYGRTKCLLDFFLLGMLF